MQSLPRVLSGGLDIECRTVSLAPLGPEAVARVGGDDNRPMLARPDLASVYERRQATYESVATVVVDVGGASPEEIAAEILALASAGQVDY